MCAFPLPRGFPILPPLRLAAPVSAPDILPCVALRNRTNYVNCPFPGVSAELAKYLLQGANQPYQVVPFQGQAKFQQAFGAILKGDLDGTIRLSAPQLLVPSADAYKLTAPVLFKPFTISVLFSANLAENSIRKRILALVGVFDIGTWVMMLSIFITLRLFLFTANYFSDRNKFLAVVSDHSSRLLIMLAIMSVFMAGMFEGGLLAKLMSPPQEYLFDDEPSFFQGVRTNKFKVYTELVFYFEQTQKHVQNAQVRQFLEASNYNPLIPIKSEKEAFTAVLDGTGVLAGLRSSLAYWSQRLCNVQVLDLPLFTQYAVGHADAVLVFNRNVSDLLIERLNKVIELNRAGINRIEQRYTQRMEVDAKNLRRCGPNTKNADKVALPLDNLLATFGVVALGALAGLAILVGERVWSWKIVQAAKKQYVAKQFRKLATGVSQMDFANTIRRKPATPIQQHSEQLPTTTAAIEQNELD